MDRKPLPPLTVGLHHAIRRLYWWKKTFGPTSDLGSAAIGMTPSTDNLLDLFFTDACHVDGLYACRLAGGFTYTANVLYG